MSQEQPNLVDLIIECRTAPDMETALEVALSGLVPAPDDRKDILDAIFNHTRVFKEVKEPNRVIDYIIMSKLEAELIPPPPPAEPVTSKFLSFFSKSKTRPGYEKLATFYPKGKHYE